MGRPLSQTSGRSSGHGSAADEVGPGAPGARAAALRTVRAAGHVGDNSGSSCAAVGRPYTRHHFAGPVTPHRMRSRTRGPPGSIGWSVIYKMVGRRPPDSEPTGPGRVGPAGPGRKPQPGSRRKAPEPRAPSGSYESVGRRAREPEVEPARAARAGRRPEWLHERLMAHAGSRTESRSRLADALAGGRGHPRGLLGPLG